jgi:hypothetical protein
MAESVDEMKLAVEAARNGTRAARRKHSEQPLFATRAATFAAF